MKRFLTFSFLMMGASVSRAAWAVPELPITIFDVSHNPISIEMCATDSVAGRLCAWVTKDVNNVSLSVNGSGILNNQPAIQTALENALNAARAEVNANTAKAASNAVDNGKTGLPIPLGFSGT